MAPADASNLYGHRRTNIASLKERFDLNEIRITVNSALARYELVLTTGEKSFKADRYGDITIVPTDGLHADV